MRPASGGRPWDVQDAADHLPVLDPRLVWLVVRQMRLDQRPGLIREPVKPCPRDFPALKTPNSRRKRERWQMFV